MPVRIFPPSPSSAAAQSSITCCHQRGGDRRGRSKGEWQHMMSPLPKFHRKRRPKIRLFLPHFFFTRFPVISYSTIIQLIFSSTITTLPENNSYKVSRPPPREEDSQILMHEISHASIPHSHFRTASQTKSQRAIFCTFTVFFRGAPARRRTTRRWCMAWRRVTLTWGVCSIWGRERRGEVGGGWHRKRGGGRRPFARRPRRLLFLSRMILRFFSLRPFSVAPPSQQQS